MPGSYLRGLSHLLEVSGNFRLSWERSDGGFASIDLYYGQDDTGSGWPPYLVPLNTGGSLDILQLVRDAIATQTGETVTVENVALGSTPTVVDFTDRVPPDPLGGGTGGGGDG